MDKKDQPVYSDKYSDSEFEYRHVFITKAMVAKMPKDKLLSEDEWRQLGVQQSHGWEHYMIHTPEPHILLFRRELDYAQKYGDRPRPAGLSTLQFNKENSRRSNTTAQMAM